MKGNECQEIALAILLTILVTNALIPPPYQFNLKKTLWRNLLALGCGGYWDEGRKAYCFNIEEAALHFNWLMAAYWPIDVCSVRNS